MTNFGTGTWQWLTGTGTYLILSPEGARTEGRPEMLKIKEDALKRLSEYAKARDLEGPFRVAMTYG
jgi:hypothetical protein